MKLKKKPKTLKPYYEAMFVPEETLDFHIYKSIDPFEVEHILNEFILDQYFLGKKNLLIVTGKGAVIRPAVKKTLSNHKYVESFKLAGYFNGQDGAFEVVLK